MYTYVGETDLFVAYSGYYSYYVAPNTRLSLRTNDVIGIKTNGKGVILATSSSGSCLSPGDHSIMPTIYDNVTLTYGPCDHTAYDISVMRSIADGMYYWHSLSCIQSSIYHDELGNIFESIPKYMLLMN
jgi:hypothetical protein